MIDLVKLAMKSSLKEGDSPERTLTPHENIWLRDQFKQFVAQAEAASKSPHERPSVTQTRQMWKLVASALWETILQIEKDLPPEFDEAWMDGWNKFLAFEKSPDPLNARVYVGYSAAMQWIFEGNGRPVSFIIPLGDLIAPYNEGWDANPTLTKNPYRNYVDDDTRYKLFEQGRGARRQYDYHHLSDKDYRTKYGLTERGTS